MMEFTNFFTKCDAAAASAMENLVLLLSPFAPHLAEELWQLLGHSTRWPTSRGRVRPRNAQERHGRNPRADQRQAPQQDRVPTGADKDEHEAGRPGRRPRIAELLAGKTVVKVIVVPGRMVNFVIK